MSSQHLNHTIEDAFMVEGMGAQPVPPPKYVAGNDNEAAGFIARGRPIPLTAQPLVVTDNGRYIGLSRSDASRPGDPNGCADDLVFRQADELTREKLAERLHYDPETGIFTRLVSDGNRSAGSVSGTNDGQGYLKIQVCGKRYRAHRLAWLYVNGSFPENEIDHINGVRSDNRIANLREATTLENCRNRGIRSDNSIGLKGVSFHRTTGKFRAKITSGGKELSLGLHDTPEEAHAAYTAAASGLYGEFANDGQKDCSRGPFNQLYSGRKFFPLDPRPEDVHIEDIAHGLANICRYSGAVMQHYSVAEHSIHIARWLLVRHGPVVAMAGLLHDAPESLSGFGDVGRPMKGEAPIIKQTEDGIWSRAIAPRFGLADELPDAVHEADNRIIADELVNLRWMDWHAKHDNPLGVRLQYMSPDRAETEFLALYVRLERMVRGVGGME